MTRDQILLEGMVFYGYHGVYEEERRLGQRFVVDLEAACDLRPAAVSDDITRTVSYSDLFRITKSVVEGTPRALIESVAETIAAAILDQFPAIAEVAVTVRKPEAPIQGSVLRGVGVRIRRGRERSAE
ncbi:MAG TPA: dihydroneopterin aldolase [Nitrolancea sp.]|nr:dihydroneopterin aldolase [Nitrolancea sp.]